MSQIKKQSLCRFEEICSTSYQIATNPEINCAVLGIVEFSRKAQQCCVLFCESFGWCFGCGMRNLFLLI